MDCETTDLFIFNNFSKNIIQFTYKSKIKTTISLKLLCRKKPISSHLDLFMHQVLLENIHN